QSTKCGFIHSCGTEKYTIKSQSPCPSGTPDCQLIMYKLSTRPVYRQRQQISTALLWRCCPGHGGHNCEDAGGSARASLCCLPVKEEVDADTLPYPEPPTALPVPDMMALVMSQLQPLLQGFNHSLELLSRQVGDLVRDVAELKSDQMEVEMQSGPPAGPELDEAAEERLDAKMDEAFQHVREVQRQMEGQRTDMENRLHSQHAMLHYNLTSFKTDIDMKLKRHQKMLQTTEYQLEDWTTEDQLEDQTTKGPQEDQTTKGPLEDHPPPPSLLTPHPPLQPSHTSALWEAIERLDNMVVNNTVTSGDVQLLRRDFKELEKHINRTARTSQVQFMETGLEVEAAREAVLWQVGELVGNLSRQGERLREMDVDVDYLYDAFYKQNSSTDCDCKGLKAAIARLERGVANVTELASYNRLALAEESDEGEGQWSEAGYWEPAVEVKVFLSTQRNVTETLDQSLNRLSGSVAVAVAEVSGMKEADRKLLEEMQHLSASFRSLLTDAIRHSDVLELLLGEEVLEFLEWPVQDQEAHSIPSIKEQLRLLQEQLRGHGLSITSLLGNKPARDRQLLLLPEGRRPEHGGDGSDLWNLEKRVEELRLKVLQLEEKSCNTSSEREDAPGDAEAKLQVEVMWLKRGLEEHLRVFKNVFSNADELAGSDATLELDKLWQLVKNKGGKKEKKRGGGGGSERGGVNHRSRRETSGVAPVPPSLSGDSLLLVAGSPLSVSNGVVAFEASLNRGQFYSDTGTFAAPLNGVYLFVLTLDLRPGPTHVVLRRGSGGAPVHLHRREVTVAGPVTDVGLLPLREGEEVRLELKGAGWTESEDNVFTVLLLHRTG
uniref:Multimerin 2a n=1 Tax=Cyclopterus lumpus TaxID=8103 RepID=A0A8C3ATQ6_CYCLU